MNVDVTYTPFSRFGSYIAFSHLSGERHAKTGLAEGLWLRCVHGDAAREVFHVELLREGVATTFEARAGASVLTLLAGEARADICIAGRDVVRIRGRGAALRLSMRGGAFNCAVPDGDGWLLNAATALRNYRPIMLAGQLRVDAPWDVARCKRVIVDLLPGVDGEFEAALEQFVGSKHPSAHDVPFDTLAAEAQSEFQDFAAPYLSAVPAELRPTAEAAAYLNWSTVVAAHGNFRRPAMLMSKNWMCNVWAWDHAFNALATAVAAPQVGWDQLMTMFDHRDHNGQLPDFINDVVMLRNFVKPPIHGWILRQMMDLPGVVDAARLREIYPALGHWTEWWLNFRDPEGNGLPRYHHGNDSGWDNGTVFDVGLPVVGCDLAAFLVVQMDVLAGLARRFGDEAAGQLWKQRADRTLAGLLEKLWRDDRFVCPSAVNGHVTEKSDSIFGCLPIVLGDRLPAEVVEALATQIRRHLTEWGPATEHPDSPLYEPDGYWRGPIWAPPTLILADGLARAGQRELAREVAARFCKLCAKSGFAENFDAVTGAPLRDRAYTWTSSVFLTLAMRLDGM